MWRVNVRFQTQPWIPDFSQDCQPENSVIHSEGRFSKNYGADQQRLQISDLHFDKFSTSATFVCWKIRFKTEVCTSSQFPTEAMLWIKEVEMVESVDDLKSSRSFRVTSGPNFEFLNARIASAFKRKVSLEEQKSSKRKPLLPRKTDRSLDLWVLLGHWSQDSVENYADLFTVVLRNDLYSGVRFEMGQNSIIHDANPIWWNHGKLVQLENTRVWETQDRIGIVQYADSSEEGWTWFSQVGDDGKKKYRVEFANEEFCGQKRKLWYTRRGQGTKTAWTKNSGKLLAVESQRAVF